MVSGLTTTLTLTKHSKAQTQYQSGLVPAYKFKLNFTKILNKLQIQSNKQFPKSSLMWLHLDYSRSLKYSY